MTKEDLMLIFLNVDKIFFSSSLKINVIVAGGPFGNLHQFLYQPLASPYKQRAKLLYYPRLKYIIFEIYLYKFKNKFDTSQEETLVQVPLTEFCLEL